MVNPDGSGPAKRPRRLIALLLAVAALFIAGAAALFIAQEAEGAEAGKRAQQLLSAVQAKGPENNPAPGLQKTYAGRQRVLEDLGETAVFAKLTIEKLELELPVISDCTDEALKISVCRYLGPLAPQDGHVVITGHNYRSGAHFGHLDRLKTGDSVSLMDVYGDVYVYEVSDIRTVRPDDMAALEPRTEGQSLSLLTCTSNANARLLIYCTPA